MPQQKRQLAAIMFTDIVGYTALMGSDEKKALELVRISREIQKPLVERHNGKWLKEMGDGILAKFNSALDAVNCAVEIQKTAKTKFEGKLRVGVHLGDVTISDNDVFGDGVNVAARLESIADAGGIYISDSMDKAIRGQTNIQTRYLGEIHLKNVNYDVRTYAVQGEGLPIPDLRERKDISGRYIAELHRRGVFRAGLTYIILSLLLILLIPHLKSLIDLPVWVPTVIYSILVIGFPMATFLAWKYERSPEGFVKTNSPESWKNPYSASQRKPLTGYLIIIGLLTIITLMYLYPRWFTNGQSKIISTSSPDPVENKMGIVIMPFDDLSPEGDNEWFSDGISEELRNALIKIPNLKVVGRTSSRIYKRIMEKDIKKIGDELGVETILDGSVRKVGTKVRISVQLVSTIDGFSLWSQTYDKDLADIFKVQDEITSSIVNTLKVYLSDRIDSPIEATTTNIDAYTKYLQARQKLFSRNIENLLVAKTLFDETISLDSNYDPAYSGLSRTISLFPIYSSNYSAKDVINPAKEAASKALDLNPQNSEAYSVLGYVATYYEWDWENAEISYKKSIEISDDDAELYNFIGDYYQVVMHPILAIEMEKKALELDPLNATSHHDLGRAYALFEDWENAIRYTKSAQSLGGLSGLKGSNAMIMLTGYIKLGQLEKGENVVSWMEHENDEWYIDNMYTILNLKAVLAIAKDESKEAARYIEQMINNSLGSYATYGRLYLSLGDFEKAAYWFEKAIENHDWGTISNPVTNGLTIPENLPDNTILRKSFDVPELNKLFDIRRNNMLNNE